MYIRSRGMTLIELIVIFSIIAILITTAIPAYTQFLNRQKSNGISQLIYQRFMLARNIAISRSEAVKFCGSRDGLNCFSNSLLYLLVFEDKNRNHRIDSDEQLYQRVDLGTEEEQLHLRAALGRHYIEIDANGRARQTGSFYYCPKNRDPHHAQRITINLAGRAYIATDDNGDGIVEMSDGSQMVC